MSSAAQQLLRSQRDVLLVWTCEHPTPLLRRLRDAGVLSHVHYLSLLECSSSNAVAQALETVCATEESSRGFLQVLKEVQDYYCDELQVWVERHCSKREEGRQKVTAVKVKENSKSLISKLFKGKRKFSVSPEVKVEDLQNVLQKPWQSVKSSHLRTHKNTLLERTERLTSYAEGGRQVFNSASHIEIRYTDLFVTEDNESFDNSQHEYFTLASRRARIYAHQACQRIHPCSLLSPQGPTGCRPKRVKVKGIAGIGKSVIVQRLVYEWALGKHMREFTCIFDLRFRELNIIKDALSLLDLLGDRFRYFKTVLKDLLASPGSLLFILDGLDEFKYQLDWNTTDRDIDVDSKVSISELMMALIKGSLLPESSVILTSRPSTDAPKRFFQRCCMVLGFEEDQLKEYIIKFYKDHKVSGRVYDYILGNDNLFVLSFIPLYCYIICTALAEFFSIENQAEDESQSLEQNPPTTVSEVYYCYLFTAAKHHALKGKAERNTPRSEVLSLVRQQLINLGRLAYEKLLKSKIMFERQDMEHYGLAPEDIENTFLSQMLVPLKENTVQMFSFFHLTVQEHLAALYCAINLSKQEDIIQALDLWCFGEIPPPSTSLSPLLSHDLHLGKTRVENLQMFTRFFMGILRTRIGGQLNGLMLAPLEVDVKEEDLPTRLGLWFQAQFKERKLANQTALNLLHCLMELHMEAATSRAASEIKRLNLFKIKLRVVDCAALHYVLQFSPHKLTELNLGYSDIGNRGLNRLAPILHRCESLYLRYNRLDREAATLESAVLKSNKCQVKKLFMCGNNFGPDGVLELWKALEQNTTLEELYLDITGITERGTENMVDSLSKNTSLKTLTMVGNDIGEVGKRRLRELKCRRPELCIIGNFVDDQGLLQAYLDWVEEIRADQDQMDSVKNADALHSILKGLRVESGGERKEGCKEDNTTKALELETKILELLNCPAHLAGVR